MAATPALIDVGAELIEVAALDRLQTVSDAVEFAILRRMRPDRFARACCETISAFKRRAVALLGKAAEPDTGLLPRPAAEQADGSRLQANAEDRTNSFEIIEDAFMPVVASRCVAIPGAGRLSRFLGKFAQTKDGCFNDPRHGLALLPLECQRARLAHHGRTDRY